MAEIRVDDTAVVGYRFTTATTADWPFGTTETTATTTTGHADNTGTTVWYAWATDSTPFIISPDIQRQLHFTTEHYRQRAEEIREQNNEANLALQRAKELLIENLDEDQRDAFENTHMVPLEVNGRHFRITRNRNYSVDELNAEERVINHLCVVPDIEVPIYDQMLALMLTLKYRFDYFMEIAHRNLF